jgi:hypothetical protein
LAQRGQKWDERHPLGTNPAVRRRCRRRRARHGCKGTADDPAGVLRATQGARTGVKMLRAAAFCARVRRHSTRLVRRHSKRSTKLKDALQSLLKDALQSLLKGALQSLLTDALQVFGRQGCSRGPSLEALLWYLVVVMTQRYDTNIPVWYLIVVCLCRIPVSS